MFLRFTHLYFPQEKIAAAKDIYLTEVAPVIRRQKGNREVLLLEPADGSNDFISFSLWEAESDIKAFEESAEYPAVIGRIKAIAAKPPLQTYYLVNE